MNPILKVENLQCRYGNQIILDNINFELQIGETMAIVGENGCGKSTLLKSIARIITDNSGSIIFEGSNLMVKKAEDLRGMGIAYMMQGGMVYSTLSVQEHLNFALLPLDKNEKETKKMEIFQNFPILQTLLTKRGGQLSGGQKQMLSFAMLLATNARLWLLDEPTAGLSPRSVEEFLLFINGINRLITVSMLVVEHNNYIIDHLKYKYYLQ